MKRLIFLSASIIMFCTLNCFADNIVEKIGDLNTQTILDPGGYRNAKWGMTKEAVKLAINDVKWEELTLKLETNKKWAKFFNKVDSIRYEDKMFDHPTIVLFDFDSNEKLKEVTLAVKPKDGGYFNSIELNEVWNSLVKILEDKYGKFTELKNSLDITWLLLSTQITMTKTWFNSNVAAIDIIYSQRTIQEGTQKDKEKL